jgi:hypothetical protein
MIPTKDCENDHNICEALYIFKIIIVLRYTHRSATYNVRGTQVHLTLHTGGTMPSETNEYAYQCFLRRIGCWILSVRGWMLDHCPPWYKLPNFHLRFHRPVWETTLISFSSSLSGAREPNRPRTSTFLQYGSQQTSNLPTCISLYTRPPSNNTGCLG